MTDVACFLGSSIGAGPSDAAKDRRALTWLSDFGEDVRQEWLARCQIIRYADRLAECDISDRHGRYRRFHVALEGYLIAIERYNRLGMAIRTVKDHDAMLRVLGGCAFRMLPYLGGQEWEHVRDFGALDQFWNNVRDLQEDLARHICYIPEEAMDSFGFSIKPRSSRWKALMSWWLNDYAHEVRARAQPFIEATGLHPSWQRFRAERLAEYARIERVFREVEYDYVAFGERYWREA
jgi:hypothetical protein